MSVIVEKTGTDLFSRINRVEDALSPRSFDGDQSRSAGEVSLGHPAMLIVVEEGRL